MRLASLCKNHSRRGGVAAARRRRGGDSAPPRAPAEHPFGRRAGRPRARVGQRLREERVDFARAHEVRARDLLLEPAQRRHVPGARDRISAAVGLVRNIHVAAAGVRRDLVDRIATRQTYSVRSRGTRRASASRRRGSNESRETLARRFAFWCVRFEFESKPQPQCWGADPVARSANAQSDSENNSTTPTKKKSRRRNDSARSSDAVRGTPPALRAWPEPATNRNWISVGS